MSGNSRSSSETYSGVVKRAASREEEGVEEDDNKIAGEPGEELLKTFRLGTSNRRLGWRKKSAPRIGTDTRASWNIQSK